MHDFALSVFPEWIDSRRRSNSSQYMVSRRRITSCMITSARASRAARNPAKETQTLIAQPISTPANPMKAGNTYPHSISAAIARRLLIGQAGNADYFLALAIALSLAETKALAGKGHHSLAPAWRWGQGGRPPMGRMVPTHRGTLKF